MALIFCRLYTKIYPYVPNQIHLTATVILNVYLHNIYNLQISTMR